MKDVDEKDFVAETHEIHLNFPSYGVIKKEKKNEEEEETAWRMKTELNDFEETKAEEEKEEEEQEEEIPTLLPPPPTGGVAASERPRNNRLRDEPLERTPRRRLFEIRSSRRPKVFLATQKR